ncbi:MAG: hypothetical protein H0T46_30130 [Deltaproteobacteria bacterium]|nr:hypothetical protein [Deltaproteobacteria bacterium]
MQNEFRDSRRGDAEVTAVGLKRGAGARAAASDPDPATGLRPFFGYYGGKWRDAKLYPPPRHETIVEPFAGSAGYSLRYASKRVILCELDPVVAAVWKYLIGVSAREILKIPDLGDDETVDDLGLIEEARWLVGFWLNRAVTRPRRSPSKWMRSGIRPGSFWGERVRNTIASQVDSIRHWKVHPVSYVDCPSTRNATWFIDPPYQCAGKHYLFGSEKIDYAALATWCRARHEQVIVCENEGATWLRFRELADVKTTRAGYRSKEVVWTSKKP